MQLLISSLLPESFIFSKAVNIIKRLKENNELLTKEKKVYYDEIVMHVKFNGYDLVNNNDGFLELLMRGIIELNFAMTYFCNRDSRQIAYTTDLTKFYRDKLHMFFNSDLEQDLYLVASYYMYEHKIRLTNRIDEMIEFIKENTDDEIKRYVDAKNAIDMLIKFRVVVIFRNKKIILKYYIDGIDKEFLVVKE